MIFKRKKAVQQHQAAYQSKEARLNEVISRFGALRAECQELKKKASLPSFKRKRLNETAKILREKEKELERLYKEILELSKKG